MPDSYRVGDAIEFAENPEPRCPCILLLDVSKSMRGEPIEALNRGLAAFHDDLVRDPLAARRVEIAIITFGQEVKVIQNFTAVDDFTPPTLKAAGLTPMGSAILKALDLLEMRKSVYKANGIAYYRPWVFMITDGKPKGEPETSVREAVRRVHEDEEQKRVAFFAVAVLDRQAWVVEARPHPLEIHLRLAVGGRHDVFVDVRHLGQGLGA
ncbi:MAG TPA: VWA domain-containing protein, partial [Armatimonadota bacterium]|nr:VWA domain-containing protein [Armatimonadota bacterium]